MQVVMPMAQAYDPDLVIVSAGFDATEGDPLGGMRVSPAGTADSVLGLHGILTPSAGAPHWCCVICHEPCFGCS